MYYLDFFSYSVPRMHYSSILSKILLKLTVLYNSFSKTAGVFKSDLIPGSVANFEINSILGTIRSEYLSSFLKMDSKSWIVYSANIHPIGTVAYLQFASRTFRYLSFPKILRMKKTSSLYII